MLVIASGNAGKVREFRHLLAGLGLHFGQEAAAGTLVHPPVQVTGWPALTLKTCRTFAVATGDPLAAHKSANKLLNVLARAEAEAQGIAAKSVTPFLLQRIFELTEGRSLASNIALVLNNARLAAAIARALSEPG